MASPTTLVICIKLLVLLVCLTSLTYVSSSAYTISKLNSDKTIHYRVTVSCLSATLVALLLQSISCIHLIFKSSTSTFQRSLRIWCLTQLFLLVILVIAFALPFSFDEHGSHESASKFWDRTSEHLSSILKYEEYIENINLWIGVVHGGVVLVGTGLAVVVGECWLKRKIGYDGIY